MDRFASISAGRGDELLALWPGWTCGSCTSPATRAGHLALYDERSGALFSGDCLQGSVYLGLDGSAEALPHLHPRRRLPGDGELVESLAPLELHGCHWPAARGDEVAAFIAETRGYVEHVDGLVRACLAEPLDADALIASVNNQLECAMAG